MGTRGKTRTTTQRPRTTSAVAAAAVVAVILSGCSGTTESTDTTSTSVVATDTAPTDTESTQFNDADVTYATGMIAHHQQAVEMSDIILAKADIDPEVVALAENIKAAQEPEIRELTEWLEDWGQNPAADSSGAMDQDGMDHGGMDHGGTTGSETAGSDDMGMMSSTDLDELRAAEGVAASRLFLEQMIVHHEGAVAMAHHHLDNGRNPAALELSEKVIADQTAEIARMRELVATLP